MNMYPRNIYILSVAVCLSFLSLSMLQPLFISVYSTSNILLISMSVAIFPFVQFFCLPVLGYLADNVGHREIMIYSALLNSFFYLLHFIAMSYNSLLAIIILRGCCGMVDVNMAASRSAISKMPYKDKHPTYMGFLNAFMHAGHVLGPLIIGLLIGRSLFDPNYIFIIISTVYLIIAFLLFKYYVAHEITIEKSTISVKTFLKSLNECFSNIILRRILLLAILSTLAVDVIYLSIPLTLTAKYSLNIKPMTLCLSLLGLGNFFSNIFLIKYLRKKQLVNIIISAHMVLLTLCCIMAYSKDIIILAIISCFCGVCAAIITTNTSALVINKINSNLGKNFGVLLSIRLLFASGLMILIGVLLRFNINPVLISAIFSMIFLYHIHNFRRFI